MASLISATAVKQDDGRFRFRVTVGGADLDWRETLDVSAEELASFERFRVVVLERTGRVAMYGPCDALSMPPADRTSAWWKHVASRLRSGG